MNVPVTGAVGELRRRYPHADVRTVLLAWNEPRAALLERRVDAAVTRLPIGTDGLDVTELYGEPRVVLVAEDHRLAGKEAISLDDIADEPIPRWSDPEWNAFWRIDPRPDGSRAPDGPLVEAMDDKLEIIAAGQAVAIVSAGLRAESLHDDLSAVPLKGVEPSRVVLATRTGDPNPLVASFRETAQAHLTSAE